MDWMQAHWFEITVLGSLGYLLWRVDQIYHLTKATHFMLHDEYKAKHGLDDA